MVVATELDLNQLVEQLSKTFEQCLDNSLSDPVSKEGKSSTDVATLKSTIIDLEQQLKGIRLECMKDKSLSLTESIALLKRDINIKQMTIDKYVGQLDNWMTVLPDLQQKSLNVLNAPSTATVSNPETRNMMPTADVAMGAPVAMDIDHSNNNDGGDDDDDDDDEDIEFEEV